MAMDTKNKSYQVFIKQKKQVLSGIDLSRKGSIDAPISDMVQFINNQRDYVTTSSCSGRICIFEDNPDGATKKKGCIWLLTEHGYISPSQVIHAVKLSTRDSCLKFEPFVLHVLCATLINAQRLHAAAVASGFRNSGITVSKKGKIVTAVRSTHSLEVPLTHKGQLLVSNEYIHYITGLANKKLEENQLRIERFFEAVKAIEKSEDTQPTPRTNPGRSSVPKVKKDQTKNAAVDDDSAEEELMSLFIPDVND